MADPNSILNTTKKALGLAASYDAFDDEVIMHINSVFGTLLQLGVGPEEGFEILDDSENWDSFLQDNALLLNSAKSYMYICVQLLFDIATMPGPVIAAKERLKLEYEWRLTAAADPPVPSDEDELEEVIILDGGGP